MITAWELYWITRLDGIQGLFITASIILGIVLITTIVFASLDSGDYEDFCINIKKAKKILVINFILFIPSVFGAILIPTTKEVAAFVIIPKIVNSEFVQETAPKEIQELYCIFKSYLQKELNIEKSEKK